MRASQRRSRPLPHAMWAAVLLTLAADGRAQSPYPTPLTIDSSGRPTRVAAGDFNSDGRLDLVVNSTASARLVFVLGGGGFSFGSRISLTVGGRPSDMAVADMDGDGIDDLVWTDETFGRVGILYARGANPVTFESFTISGPDEAAALALFDRDADGWIDVVVAHRGADAIRWYRNTGTGLEAGEVLEVGDGPASLAVLRRSGGVATLAVGQSGYLARDTLLLDPITSARLGRFPMESPGLVAAGDLFVDGSDELLLTDRGTGRVTVLGRPEGEWITRTSFDAEPGAVVTRVLPSSSPDRRLIVAESSRNRLRVWRDDGGDGNFASVGSWFVGADVRDFLLADVNGDGADEVVIPLPEANVVKIVQTVGDELLAPRAQLTARLPIRIERDRGVGDSDRVVVLGIGDREAWVYGVRTGRLELETKVKVPAGAKEVALADLDGQHGTDLLVLDGNTGVWRALANASGEFGPLELVAPVVGSEDFEAARIVGGPAADLAVSDPSIPGLRLFEGDGSGGFTAHSTLTTEERVFVVRSTDLDLDGFADLVVLGEIDDLVIFYGGATGPGAGVNFRVGGTPRDLVFGNFNGDAFPDMVVTSAGQSSFSVLMSVFAGFYSVATRNAQTLFGSQNCEAFDFTGDGLDDVLISGPGSSLMALHIATGNASLGPFVPIPTAVPTTVAPLDVRALHLDGDAIADLLVLDHFSGLITTILSDPLAGLEPVHGTITGWWQDDAVELLVTADARQTSELDLRRSDLAQPLRLVPGSTGQWTARDTGPGPAQRSYLLRDRLGREIDRVDVTRASGTTDTENDEGSRILPARWRDGVAQIRFRLSGNPRPEVRVYDLRGRRVADLVPAPLGNGWYQVRWDARDRAGRRAAHARYLVRVQGGGEQLVTSVLLR